MTETPELVRRTRIGDIAVLTLAAPPVNALGAALRRQLQAAVAAADRDTSVAAIVITGAGRGFSGGADITEFGKPPQAPSLAALLATLDACGEPIVAAIHGMALGGGLELALACHARIAAPKAMLGLPEVKLGILPGAGGTQRLPRLIGPEPALEMIALGAPVDAAAAQASGLVDLVADDVVDAAVRLGRDLADGACRARRTRDLDDKIASFRDLSAPFAAFAGRHAKKFRGFAAPAACIAALEAAVTLPFDEGLARERALFAELVAGDQSAAQRHIFFAERKVVRVPDIPEGTETYPIERVGIVGAGTMGIGIATAFLDAGYPVTVVETLPDALERGLATIRRTLTAGAEKGRSTADEAAARGARLTGAVDLSALAECDLIVEAVFELMEVKTEVFAALDRIAKPGAFLASNTSYLDIDTIAAATARPDHVLGLHFFSPANVMRLVEVVRGTATAKPVLATAMALVKWLGKVAVPVRVGHGFVGNRMLAARQRQAQQLVLEGALPWDVDRVLYDFGLPMGPFAMADLAGLDLGWRRETSTGATLREILCERDRRGQKTGGGYYDYDSKRIASPSPQVEALILDLAARRGIARRHVADDEILERCLLPMVNEGAKILDEGIAARASDIDVVWVYGYGWPAYRGGPMFWADGLGLGHVLERLAALAPDHGNDFAPAPLLQRLASEGWRFADL